jgi:predicted nuclease of restriction endonuclease-like (RecB) superfamily
MPADYVVVLADLKRRISAAQARAAHAVSRELMAPYWHVGGTIVRRQAEAGWGDAVVERLAHDLRQAFPDLEGFSARNIWRMRAFFLAWSGAEGKLTQAVSEIGKPRLPTRPPKAVSELPWGHDIMLLQQVEVFCLSWKWAAVMMY